MKTVLLLTILLFVSCESQKGYSDLDELYADFIVYLKDPNPKNLKHYCHLITPDQETVDYMKENGFSYRGIPDELEKQNLAPSLIGDKYYESVLVFRERLVRSNQLNSLTYIGREQEGEALYDKRLDIYVTETFILLEAEGDTLECKLGEMFRINNKWKSFTSPKLGW